MKDREAASHRQRMCWSGRARNPGTRPVCAFMVIINKRQYSNAASIISVHRLLPRFCANPCSNTFPKSLRTTSRLFPFCSMTKMQRIGRAVPSDGILVSYAGCSIITMAAYLPAPCFQTSLFASTVATFISISYQSLQRDPLAMPSPNHSIRR